MFDKSFIVDSFTVGRTGSYIKYNTNIIVSSTKDLGGRNEKVYLKHLLTLGSWDLEFIWRADVMKR